MQPKKIVWDRLAYHELEGIYEYIKQDSLKNADKVKQEILAIIDKLPDNPERHPPDKLKKKNKGDHRAFNKYSYRISYQIKKEIIVILRVRHAKREPLDY